MLRRRSRAKGTAALPPPAEEGWSARRRTFLHNIPVSYVLAAPGRVPRVRLFGHAPAARGARGRCRVSRGPASQTVITNDRPRFRSESSACLRPRGEACETAGRRSLRIVDAGRIAGPEACRPRRDRARLRAFVPARALAPDRGPLRRRALYAFQCLSTMSLTASEMATSNTSISSTGRRVRSC
jgi:hypothetical protein